MVMVWVISTRILLAGVNAESAQSLKSPDPSRRESSEGRVFAGWGVGMDQSIRPASVNFSRPPCRSSRAAKCPSSGTHQTGRGNAFWYPFSRGCAAQEPARVALTHSGCGGIDYRPRIAQRECVRARNWAEGASSSRTDFHFLIIRLVCLISDRAPFHFS